MKLGTPEIRPPAPNVTLCFWGGARFQDEFSGGGEGARKWSTSAQNLSCIFFFFDLLSLRSLSLEHVVQESMSLKYEPASEPLNKPYTHAWYTTMQTNNPTIYDWAGLGIVSLLRRREVHC